MVAYKSPEVWRLALRSSVHRLARPVAAAAAEVSKRPHSYHRTCSNRLTRNLHQVDERLRRHRDRLDALGLERVASLGLRRDALDLGTDCRGEQATQSVSHRRSSMAMVSSRDNETHRPWREPPSSSARSP